MATDTHKVEVVPVVLEPHPNADRLSIVHVYNFQVVVGTEDWIGVDKAAYVQPDSVMPDTPEYRFLKETSSLRKEKEELGALLASSAITREEFDTKLAAVEARIDANTKYLRITVKKLRGVISMGMLIPRPEGAEIGDDVAEQLGITHYEPPTAKEIEGSRRHTGDDVAPPPPMIYAPEYDVENGYRWAKCFEPGEPVYVTEKLDGQNARFVATMNGNEWHVVETPGGQRYSACDVTLHVGSHTEWKKKEGGSNWWRVLEQNPWIEQWCYDNQDLVLYGEVFGWVQELRYGAKQGQLWFRAFDILNGTEYWDAQRFIDAFPYEHRVPSFGIMPFDFEALQKLADGPSLILGAKHEREGIVIKPLKERQHYKLGRVMVKLVSNKHLEKSSRQGVLVIVSEKPMVKPEEEAAQQLRNLRSAVESLYYSAVWHADRPADEAALWIAVRDAAGFKPGHSPKELPYSGLRAEYPLGKLRQIATAIRKDRSAEFSTGQMAAFLDLYREDLEARVNDAVRKFLEEKLG